MHTSAASVKATAQPSSAFLTRAPPQHPCFATSHRSTVPHCQRSATDLNCTHWCMNWCIYSNVRAPMACARSCCDAYIRICGKYHTVGRRDGCLGCQRLPAKRIPGQVRYLQLLDGAQPGATSAHDCKLLFSPTSELYAQCRMRLCQRALGRACAEQPRRNQS